MHESEVQTSESSQSSGQTQVKSQEQKPRQESPQEVAGKSKHTAFVRAPKTLCSRA